MFFVGANTLSQILKGEVPVCALSGKMVRQDDPDGQNDGCGDNNSHKGGPEQPHLLQRVGKHIHKERITFAKSVWLLHKITIFMNI